MRRAARAAVALGLRRVAGTHPGADVDVGQAQLAQRCADSRQRCLQVALDVVGERLERGDVDDLRLVLEPAVQALPHQRSMAARKAASVLPEPVGAATSTCRPAWIAGQACACAAVGAAKLWANHAAIAG